MVMQVIEKDNRIYRHEYSIDNFDDRVEIYAMITFFYNKKDYTYSHNLWIDKDDKAIPTSLLVRHGKHSDISIHFKKGIPYYMTIESDTRFDDEEDEVHCINNCEYCAELSNCERYQE